jgi:hypothetical protein
VGCTALPQRVVTRPVPGAWAPRLLVVAGVVVAGWILGGAGVAEAAHACGATAPRPPAAADTGSRDAASGHRSTASTSDVHSDSPACERGQARHEPKADIAAADSGTVRRIVATADAAARTALDFADQVSEPTRPATGDVRDVVTPTLDRVGDALEPASGPVDEVIPSDHGEPQEPSIETPGGKDPVLCVETPPALGVPASTPEPGQPSSGPPAPPALPTGDAFVLSAAGPGAPAPTRPGLPTSGEPLAGFVGSASGPGTADRLFGAAGDVVPVLVSPRLITRSVTAGHAVVVRERASRPAVSPD